MCQCRAGRDVWASKCNVQRFRRRAQNLGAKRVGTICHRSAFDLPTPVIAAATPRRLRPPQPTPAPRPLIEALHALH